MGALETNGYSPGTEGDGAKGSCEGGRESQMAMCKARKGKFLLGTAENRARLGRRTEERNMEMRNQTKSVC